MNQKVFLLFIVLSLSFGMPQDKITVYLVGDSTMSQKDQDAFPETGWGMPFIHFFDSTVSLENHAKNGRSTKSFLAEDRWKTIVERLHPGDYVFIQFGHNDESESKPERYTTLPQFESNLTQFVTDTQQKKAIPILLTPVARRRFDDLGHVKESHPGYSEVVRKVANQLKVPFIDLDKKSQEVYEKMGMENSKLLFLQLEPGEHPNYPNGKVDNTHFNELGARLVAQLVLEEIKHQNLGLSQHIVQGKR